MDLVDVHAHWLPDSLRTVLGRRRLAPRLEIQRDGGLIDCGGGLVYPLLDALEDAAVHLRRMDREGITRTLLSVPPPGVNGLPVAESVAVARHCNDELAALSARSGGRLLGLGVLPLCDPLAAAEELRRACLAGLAGAQLPSNVRGAPLDGAEFLPLFAAAAELDCTLVLHPVVPRDPVPVREFGLLTTLGFVYDSSIAAARLVLSGVFDRHPDLKLLLPHAGATLPFLLGRFDYEFDLMCIGGRHGAPPSEQLRLLFLDTISASARTLRVALEEYGPERLLYGSDEPFWRSSSATATLDDLALDRPTLAAIRYENADRLFRSSRPTASGA